MTTATVLPDLFSVDWTSPLWFFKRNEAALRDKWPDLFKLLDKDNEKILPDTAWTLYRASDKDAEAARKAVGHLPFECYHIYNRTDNLWRWAEARFPQNENTENPEWLNLQITVADLLRIGRLVKMYLSCDQQAQQSAAPLPITGEMLDSLIEIEWTSCPLPKNSKLTLRKLLGLVSGAAFVSPFDEQNERNQAPYIYCPATCNFFALTHTQWLHKHASSTSWRVHAHINYSPQSTQVRMLLGEVIDYYLNRFAQAQATRKHMGPNGAF